MDIFLRGGRRWFTIPETNIDPENGWLEDDISRGYVSFRESTMIGSNQAHGTQYEYPSQTSNETPARLEFQGAVSSHRKS